MTVPPISVGLDPEPLLTDSWRHFERPKSAIWTQQKQSIEKKNSELKTNCFYIVLH